MNLQDSIQYSKRLAEFLLLNSGKAESEVSARPLLMFDSERNTRGNTDTFVLQGEEEMIHVDRRKHLAPQVEASAGTRKRNSPFCVDGCSSRTAVFRKSR